MTLEFAKHEAQRRTIGLGRTHFVFHLPSKVEDEADSYIVTDRVLDGRTPVWTAETRESHPMNDADIRKALVVALHRQMPVEGYHSGRGWGHSEACYRSCFDSWERTVREIAHELSRLDSTFDKRAWFATVSLGIRSDD